MVLQISDLLSLQKRYLLYSAVVGALDELSLNAPPSQTVNQIVVERLLDHSRIGERYLCTIYCGETWHYLRR